MRKLLSKELQDSLDWKPENLQKFTGEVPGLLVGLPGDDPNTNPLVQLISPYLGWREDKVLNAYRAGEISERERLIYEKQRGVRLVAQKVNLDDPSFRR